MFGPQSSDEMCELGLHVQPKPSKAEILSKDNQRHLYGIFLTGAESSVRTFPESADAHARLGTLLTRTDLQRARQELTKAIELDSNCERAHFQMGLLFRSEDDFLKAKRELETAL